MVKKSYYEKLKDPRWQKKRLEILERNDWQCRSCGSKENQLHIHHLKYGKNPWDIDNRYLLSLCENCHKYVSDANDVIIELIADSLDDGSSSDIVQTMKDIYKFIHVCLNCNTPWGSAIEDVKIVIESCINSAKNRGYWESINRE